MSGGETDERRFSQKLLYYSKLLLSGRRKADERRFSQKLLYYSKLLLSGRRNLTFSAMDFDFHKDIMVDCENDEFNLPNVYDMLAIV